MIAYDDLVVALSSWRAGQGLPPNTVNFLSADTGSVDLALPVAEPVDAMELETGEVQALDDDYAVDEYAVDEYAVEEAVESDDPFGAEASDDEFESATPEDDSASPVHALNYDDDESEQTAIASDFEAATAYGDGAPAEASPAYDGDMSAAADDVLLDVSDDDSDQAMEALPSGAAGEPQTEEVDVLSEELAGSEEEGPTQFGDLDREATEMGIGLDSLQQPGPRSDTEE